MTKLYIMKTIILKINLRVEIRTLILKKEIVFDKRTLYTT